MHTSKIDILFLLLQSTWRACHQDAVNDAFHLAWAAKIVCSDMFRVKQKFDDSFEWISWKDSVPTFFLAIVLMVFNEPDIKEQSIYLPPFLMITQLLMHHSSMIQCKQRKRHKYSKA